MVDSEEKRDAIWLPGTPTGLKIFSAFWLILSLGGAVFVGIETGSRLATLFSIAVFLLPGALIFRIARYYLLRRK